MAAHLAFLAVAPLFLSPTVLFWLSGLGIVWMLMEPSRIGGESLASARRRSIAALVRDPLAWVLLLVLAYATLRLANGGVAMAYDAEANVWALAAPQLPELPGSAAGAGWRELSGLLALAVVVLALRHALGKAARCAFLALASVVAGSVALVLALRLSTGSVDCLRLASCTLSNPSYVGTVFGLYLVAAVAILPDALSRRWYALLFPLLFALCGNAVGLFLFAPPALAAFWAALAVLALVFCVIYAHVTGGPARGLQVLLVTVLCLAGAALLVRGTAPAAVLQAKTCAFEEGRLVPEEYLPRRAVLERLSESMWRTRSWTGVGLGAYPLALKFHAQPEDWESLPASQCAALNGCWTLLAERGLVGAFAIALPLMLLVWTYLKRLVRGVTLAFPGPLALFGLLATAALAAESLVATTAFSPAALVAAALWLTLAAYSFPKEKSNG